jgi:uncharacterized protein
VEKRKYAFDRNNPMTEKALQLLLKEFHVPEHIRAHMEKVARIAALIGKKLVKKGGKVDLKALEQAARLHDLVKICDFRDIKKEFLQERYTPEDLICWSNIRRKYHHLGHVQAAFEILKQRGEEKIATIVKKHRFSCIIDIDTKEQPITWEEKILYYADKRVQHDRIVSLKQRIDDGRMRYFPDGNIPEDDEKTYRAIIKLEKELCQASGVDQDEINDAAI